MAKLTGIEVAKFLAKQSKADRNYIERAAQDFRKRGGKGKRKATKRASSASSKKATSKGADNGKRPAFRPSKPSAPAGAAAESTGG